MPHVQTKYFGNIEFPDETVIHTPAGIPGFAGERAFLLIQLPGQYPLVYLQSMLTPGLCFPALPVRVASAHYQLEIGDEDREILGVGRWPSIGREVLCLGLLAAHDDGPPTVNLAAPVVIHLKSRTAAQCVNVAGPYDLRQALEPGAPA